MDMPIVPTWHLEDWKRESRVVQDVLTWRRCNSVEMREASRFGIWLADVVYTVMLVELNLARLDVEFVVVQKGTYAELAAELCVKGDRNNASYNLGNVFEFLTWVTLEEIRFEWIVALAAYLACTYACVRVRDDC